MSREIKYRQYINGSFHYWGFIDGGFISPKTVDGIYEEALKTSEQCTGLLDKNGREIYEGDILELENVRGAITGVMNWDTERQGWTQFEPIERFTIIGNIHEHPHLLNKKGNE